MFSLHIDPHDAYVFAFLGEEEPVVDDVVPRRLRRAEKVLSHRTSRVLLVLDRCEDSKCAAAPHAP